MIIFFFSFFLSFLAFLSINDHLYGWQMLASLPDYIFYYYYFTYMSLDDHCHDCLILASSFMSLHILTCLVLTCLDFSFLFHRTGKYPHIELLL